MVSIREVGPRDGFQNEPEVIATADKVRLIDQLARTGLRRLEVTSFVRADVIPQLADAGEVLEAIDPPAGVSLSVLIPNERGLEHALRHRAASRRSTSSCRPRRRTTAANVNRSIEESLSGLERVLARARAEGLRCEGVISVAFGCPYEGRVPPERVFAIARRLIAAGAEEIGFGDTTGMANPAQVRDYFPAARAALGADAELTAHFHNTRGQGLANVYAAYEAGVRSFESSFGELGGCPVPKGATGNVATEDVVSMLHEMGAETGIDLAGAARGGARRPGGARPPARLAPADRGAGRLGQRPLNSGWRFSRNARAPSAKSAVAAQRSCETTSSSSVAASAGRADASITRLASATATGAHASSSSASCCTAASSSSAGATRLASPIRSASSAPISLPVMISSFARPRPTICGSRERAADVGDQADPRLGHADDRVGRQHAEVARERQLERAADARALDRADHRLGHLLGEVPGLQAAAPERAQVLGRRRERAERAEVHARGEHRAGAAQHDAAHRRVVGRRAQRLAGREHELAVERVALLGAVEDDVADRAVIF